jgi:CBS-domain-containing membrane protein
LGQILSLSIAILISQIDWLTIWMKQSLSTALAVAAMAKLGVVHPPAGAAALIFASGDNFTWTNLASMLVGNVVCEIKPHFCLFRS